MKRLVVALFIPLIYLGTASAARSSDVTVTVRNPTNLTRLSETITLDASTLRRLLSVDDIRRVHVRDVQSGQDLLTQAVDTNGDGKYEELIFQTNIAPNETKKFALSVGERRIPTPQEFKAYGRFVREREGDFAWENDRIAHRMYGKALETSLIDPLTSSAVDVWVKRVSRLVINDWYMVDDYHREHGEGGDFYNAGSTRGCGGNGIWKEGQLYPSTNFIDSRVLANGPIRVMFELTYPAWDANGTAVAEVKQVSLDAGQNFDRFESRYTLESHTARLTDAIGIRKGTNAAVSEPGNTATMRTWETLPDDHGQLGCAVIADPANFVDFKEDARNFLMIVKVPENRTAVYYAGFGWSKSSFPTAEAWNQYVTQYARQLRSPLEVTMSGQ
ncbi:MAG TPA: DUF4861 family protein [Candidatus Acidoferrales bacterium]|nr:DUF4861 family protein [Candidatus Acidoferrales bacterium]